MFKLLSSRALPFSLMLLAASCGGGGGGGGAEVATADVAGTWSIVEEVTQATGPCAGEIGTVSQYSLDVTQQGTSITVVSPAGTFQGSINGNRIQWTGSYPEDGGITTITSMDIRVDGSSLSGTTTFAFTDGVINCTGATRVSGTRTSGGGTATAAASLAGTWSGNEQVLSASGPPCSALVGRSYSARFRIEVGSGGLLVRREGFSNPSLGQLDGGTLLFATNEDLPQQGSNLVERYAFQFDFTTTPASFAGVGEWELSQLSGPGFCTGVSAYTGTLDAGAARAMLDMMSRLDEVEW